jgi:hypothetical protein
MAARERRPAACSGNSSDHCCYVSGVACRFLEENTVPGRRWACGLRRELGSWEAVHTDARYLRHVQPMWDRLGGSCGDWPRAGKKCEACGVSGG